MPPQPASPAALPAVTAAKRGTVSCLMAFAAVLSGCATTDTQRSQAGDDYYSPLIARHNSYASLHDTRSDPLAAYLNRYGQSSLPVDAPDSRDLANAALDHLGIKYRFGGDTPSTGFDCSGLVAYAAEQSLGLKLPRRSAELARVGISVKRTELQEGDLVFFNTLGARFSHVGIYLGDSKFVHAPRSGGVVRIESINTNYWKKRYNGARRLDTQTLTALLSEQP